MYSIDDIFRLKDNRLKSIFCISVAKYVLGNISVYLV